MRTYQIIFKGGLVRNVRADGYRTTDREIIFHTDNHPTEQFESDSVLWVEDLDEMPEYWASLQTEAAILTAIP